MGNHVLITDYLWFQEGPGVRNTQYTSSGVKLLNVANFVDGNIDLSTSSRYISDEEAYGKYKHFLVDEGDFLIASSGIQVDYFEKKMGFIRPDQLPLCMNTSTIRFKNLKPNDLDMRYFMYYLKSNAFKNQLAKHIVGSAQLNFGPSHLKKMTFPVVNIEKQRYIVENLDKLYTLIVLRKEQLAKLDQLVKSRFIELFGDLASPECQWRREKLVDACADPDDIKCGPFGTQLSKDEYQSEGISVWEIPQINSRFMTSPTHYLTENKAKQLDAYSIKAGDIAMSRKGNVGKCAVFPADYEEGIIHSDVLRIRVDSKRVLPIFMMHQLHYSRAVQHQIELVSSGAIMAGINVTKLKQIFVHIPPIELQSQFVTFVEQTDKSKLAIQQSLDKLETLKKSLMQEYFG